MTTSTSSYVFDQAWQGELERLRSLEAVFDTASQRYIAALGLAPGWHCLEIGCGAGGLATWLAERVGPRGSVLATDLDPRFLEAQPSANLTVMRHDINSDALAPATFDLIHARAVVEYLHDPEAALSRLVQALRPGGWLILEDVDFGGTAAEMLARYTVPPDNANRLERTYKAVAAVFERAGARATFGTCLPDLLMRAGLSEVGGEVHAPLLACGGPGGWVSLSFEQLRPVMSAMGLLSAADLREDAAFFGDPNARYLPPFMASMWGRRARVRL